VQNVLLPSHHLDAPGTPPRCKGFAFVVLSALSDTDTLLRHWPRDITDKNQCEGEDSSVREARTAGFRCLSKRDWDRLEVEYLAHREHLLLQMEENQDDMSPEAIRPKEVAHFEPQKQVEDGHMDTTFPRNRLLLVRGVHVRTNRTALKSLLSRAVGTLDAIEYVDYTKGMDSVRDMPLAGMNVILTSCCLVLCPRLRYASLDYFGVVLQGKYAEPDGGK
jgi:hypothetical protein